MEIHMPEYDYLISLQPHHTDRILAGEKTVEFRRRAPAIPNGSRLWVYSKRPRGRVEAVAKVTGLLRDRPDRL
jgi:predicted transcriptional regulator